MEVKDVTKMSVFLNRDEIKNIDSMETQQKILAAISKYIKEIAPAAESIEIDIFSTPEKNTNPVFTKESDFYKMMGSFEGPSDLAENHDHYLKETK
jgi:hypothetical protein